MESRSVVASRGKGGETGLAVVPVRPARERSVAIAVVVALVLHVVAFGAMVGGTILDILTEEEDPLVDAAPLLPERTEDALVELNAAELLAMRESLVTEERQVKAVEGTLPDPEPVEPLERGPVNYAKTNPSQESNTPPEEAVFIGERNTLEAAELPPAKDGLELPSQKGVESVRNERNLFDSDFSPGEEEGRTGGEDSELQQPEGDSSSAAEKAVAPQAVGEGAEAQGSLEKDLSPKGNPVEVPVKESPESEEEFPRASEGEREAAVTGKGNNGKDEGRIKAQANGGFRTESKRTRMEGTISRRGKSSLKVEATALGKYKAQVNRVIENEWQNRCVTHRDHLLPGILTLRFYVAKDGGVSGLRYLDVFQASAIQKGFTMKAVQKSKLPVMSEEVIKELEGELLEFHINFHF